MNKLWRVAVFDYKRNVYKKSFIFTLLSVPLILAFCIGVGLFIESGMHNSNLVGYVDKAGVIKKSVLSPEIRNTWLTEFNKPVEFIAYPSEEQAQTALKEKIIQAYYLIPTDYFLTRHVIQVYLEKPGNNSDYQFFDFLQLNLVEDKPQEIAFRVAFGTKTIVRSLDAKRFVPESGPTFGSLMPLFINLSFLGLIMASSGYTISAMAEEKENRTQEILITSISNLELIGGKILGIVLISLTMLITWSIVVFIGIFSASRMGISWFKDLSMDFRIVISTLAIALPAYVLVTALMVAIGSAAPSEKEGQSFATIFIIFHIVPLYLGIYFMKTPHSPVAIILSMMPFTGLMAIGVRNFFSIVPTWQVLASVASQIIWALVSIRFAIWAFRFVNLRFGQRLKWVELFTLGRIGSL